LNRFLREHDIDILAVTETRHKGVDLANAFENHIFFGNSYSAAVGGVGFLLRKDLIEGAKIEFMQGQFENSLFIGIDLRGGTRPTVFCVVYGK